MFNFSVSIENDTLSSVKCKVDENTYQSCTSSFEANGLSIGGHAFYIKATGVKGEPLQRLMNGV